LKTARETEARLNEAENYAPPPEIEEGGEGRGRGRRNGTAASHRRLMRNVN